MTRSVWPEPLRVALIGVYGFLVLRDPGVGQNTDAAGEVSLNRHLLAVQQCHRFPAGPSAGNGCRETGVEIGGDREGHRHQLVGAQIIAIDKGIHQGADRRFDGLGRGR